MTPAQSRAARALLNWPQDTLAEAARVSVTSIRNFERGASTPMVNNLSAMQRALEDAGVVFIREGGNGPGVRLRKDEFPEWFMAAAAIVRSKLNQEAPENPDNHQRAIAIVKRLVDEAWVWGEETPAGVQDRVLQRVRSAPSISDFPERAIGID